MSSQESPLLFIFNPCPSHDSPHILHISHPHLHSLAKGPILTSYSMFHDMFGSFPRDMKVEEIVGNGLPHDENGAEDSLDEDELVSVPKMSGKRHRLVLRAGRIQNLPYQESHSSSTKSPLQVRLANPSQPHHFKCLYCMEYAPILDLLKANPVIEQLEGLELDGAPNHIPALSQSCFSVRRRVPESAMEHRERLSEMGAFLDEMQSDDCLRGSLVLDLSSEEVLVSHLPHRETALCTQHILMHKRIRQYRNTPQWQFAVGEGDVSLIHQFEMEVSERGFPVRKYEEIVKEQHHQTKQKRGKHALDQEKRREQVQLLAIVQNGLALGVLLDGDTNSGCVSPSTQQHSPSPRRYLKWMHATLDSILESETKWRNQLKSRDNSHPPLPNTLYACALRSQSSLCTVTNPHLLESLGLYQQKFQSQFESITTRLCEMMDENRQRRRCVMKRRWEEGVFIYFVGFRRPIGVQQRSGTTTDDLYIMAVSHVDPCLEAQIEDLFV